MKHIFLMGLAASTLAAASEYFPLAQGNSWTYRSAQTGEQFTINVGLPVAMTAGQVYHQLTGYGPQRLLVRHEGERLVFLDEESGKEQLLTAFRPSEGEWWESFGRECRQEGQTPQRLASHEGPAGRWAGVLEIRYRTIGCADTGVQSEQYAANIGMLQRTVTTFAGPRTFDLVQARIGSQTIDSGLRGAFSVTVAEDLAGGNWIATLRLEAAGGSPLRLHFPSGQDFEALLRDADGRVLWRWSDGLAFIQGEHSREVSSVWEMARIPIAFPASVSGPLTIEAWLTTEPRGARYGAAVTVTVPASRRD